MGNIKKTISKSLKAGQIFREQGYVLCDIYGFEDDEAKDCEAFGILSKEYVPLKKGKDGTFWRFIRFIFGLKRRRYFLGVMWFYSLPKNVTGGKVLFEVYGRRHHNDLLSVAKDIADKLETDIDVCLTSEKVVHEKLPYPR